MAGKSLSKEDLAQAVASYCAATGKTFGTGTDGKIRIFADAPGDNDPVVWWDAGKIMDNRDGETQLDLIEYWPQDRARGPNLAVRGSGRITSRSQVEAPSGSALEAVRACQATEKATYSTGGKRKAAAAKTNIAALIEAGGSLEVVKRIHTPDYIEVIGRATLGDQHTDGSRSFYKQEYLAKKAWEWIIKVLIKEPEIVSGVDEYGMPEFKEGAIIKVRINDEDRNSFLVALPAKIALWREMAREWQAAGRVCETVAYSRASDMLLRGDFQSKEEIAEEQAEVDGIQNAAKAEAGA